MEPHGQASYLKRIASEEMLWTSWDEVREDKGAPGVDGVSVADFEAEAPDRIRELSERLLTRRYRPRPLRRVWVPKDFGSEEFRAISVPAVRDRIVARAAHNVLEHVFEPRFNDSSHGFRSGRGTLTALRHVLRLRDRGYLFVAQGDVDEFFDSVEQHRLFERLEGLLPWEVRRLLILWTRIWVWDGEDRFRLRRGLPQGTSTSPLLANFFLTPFDDELERQGFQAVRYADDIILLARDEDEASRGLELMESALADLGLRLNPSSRMIRSFQEGFEYLGFELEERSLRIATSKVLEFRRHATEILGNPRAGPMRRRIALLNRMIRGWRSYYRIGVPDAQFDELDAWLEEEVKDATLTRWSMQRPDPRDLALTGLESLGEPGRRIFTPPRPPTLEGYEYRIPVEAARSGANDEDGSFVRIPRGSSLGWRDGPSVCMPGARDWTPLAAQVRDVVIEDGVQCESTILRRLLRRGIALQFVAPEPSPSRHLNASSDK